MNYSNKLKKTQCRTCYTVTKGLRHLNNKTKCGAEGQQKSYAELIAEVSSINIIQDGKELPQFICGGCSRKLKESHAFIQQIHDVNERLMVMLADEKEVNKQLECLQEAPVDIQSFLEIKVEQENCNANSETDAKCHLNLKIEDQETLLQNNLDIDVLCDKKSVKLILLEQHKSDLKCDINNIENINNGEIFERLSPGNVAIKTNSLTVADLIQAKENENSHDDNQVDNKEETIIEWQDCREELVFVSSEAKEKKKFKKSKNTVVKAFEDDDVAVPCSQCNKIFSNSKALVRHQRTSHIPEDQKCTCPLCFRKFSRSCNMYTHMRTFHGPDTVPLIRKPSTKERIFQCDKCPRNYTKRKHLNIHIKNKHSQKNEVNEKNKQTSIDDIRVTKDEALSKLNKPKRYEVRSLCSICGSSFSSKTHLIVHMRRHTGERPFKCDLCDRAYPRISELTCHRRIHTGEKPFACKICGKTFRVSSKMTTHMRSHTDIRPYKCTQCERSFKYSKDLSIHFRIHTGERPYRCNVCGSTFTQSNTLKAHRAKLGHMEITKNLS